MDMIVINEFSVKSYSKKFETYKIHIEEDRKGDIEKDRLIIHHNDVRCAGIGQT